MDRRQFVAGAGALACAASASAFDVARDPKSRPNILIVITDETTWNAAGALGSSQYVKTPNIDSIVKSGTVFPNAYSANPICVPSRTAMFTGRYPTETGVMTNADLDGKQLDPAKFPIMGKMFADQGYDTAYYGKWHVSCAVERANIHGFNRMVTTFNEDESTAVDAAMFLREKHTAPFLCVASFLNPHNICEWARGEALPLGDIPPLPPVEQCPPMLANSAPQRDETDIMAYMRRSYQAAPAFPVGKFGEREWRRYRWAYFRMIEKVDAQIGEVLRALRETRLDDNTIVLFVADHGDAQGAHGWNQKTVFYEEVARVPFVISRKGAKPQRSATLVNAGTDLIPTVCDYAGIAWPKSLPGVSMKDPEAVRRNYVVSANHMVQGVPVDGVSLKPQGRMVRSQRYKYCVQDAGEHPESLVDLEQDPGEMVNLARDPAHRDTLLRHRAMLAEWGAATKDTFHIPTT